MLMWSEALMSMNRVFPESILQDILNLPICSGFKKGMDQ